VKSEMPPHPEIPVDPGIAASIQPPMRHQFMKKAWFIQISRRSEGYSKVMTNVWQLQLVPNVLENQS
jgi:hypothetical protein